MTLRETGLSRIGRGSLLADKYRLEMLLGEGGMGFVWSAYNRELELPVAIKLLRTGRNRHHLAERLRLEARAAARLVHPSIVRIFDVAVTQGGDPFIVMELLTGETLAEALSRGPLGAVRAVQLLLPIADALALAHAKGIVHRDLKPDNVFLSTDGEQIQPKLLDFGIAKLGYGGPSYPKLTEDGVVLGSPHYMSPEQVAGEDVDQRSDTWSLCVVLYKALTGNVPFSGADKRAVMDAILRDPPAPISEASHLDAALGDILRWGLSKDPLDRPQSVRELGQALARWLLQQGVGEDACGTPLAAKWLSPAARVTIPCGPAAAPSHEHDTDPEQHWFTSQPPLALEPEESVESVEVSRPPRRRHRELVAAVGLLILGGSLAWTDSARTSVKAAPVATVEHREAPPPRARAPRSQAPRAHSAPPSAPRTSEPAAAATGAAPAPRAAPPKRSPPARKPPPPQLPF